MNAPDYYSTFIGNPDGLRLELVALRSARNSIADRWDEFETILNPLADFRARKG